MAVPKYKTSRARTRQRRSINMRLMQPTLATCFNCGAFVVRHRVCLGCGYYRGRSVLKI